MKREFIFYVIAFLIAYPLAILVASGILEAWVIFWEYGRQFNETTLPPLIAWDVFFEVLPMSLILGLILTPFVIAMLMCFIHKWYSW